MCRVLGVSRAGFYAWERRAPCDRALQDAWLLEKIRAIHAALEGDVWLSAGACGAAARACMGFYGAGERLMADHGLSGSPWRAAPAGEGAGSGRADRA